MNREITPMNSLPQMNSPEFVEWLNTKFQNLETRIENRLNDLETRIEKIENRLDDLETYR